MDNFCAASERILRSRCKNKEGCAGVLMGNAGKLRYQGLREDSMFLITINSLRSVVLPSDYW